MPPFLSAGTFSASLHIRRFGGLEYELQIKHQTDIEQKHYNTRLQYVTICKVKYCCLMSIKLIFKNSVASCIVIFRRELQFSSCTSGHKSSHYILSSCFAHYPREPFQSRILIITRAGKLKQDPLVSFLCWVNKSVLTPAVCFCNTQMPDDRLLNVIFLVYENLSRQDPTC